MWNWIKSLFGYGEIKTVEAIMAPLVKTRDNLVDARDRRNITISDNVKKMKAIEQANIAHASQASLAVSMIEGLNEQLKPLDALKGTK